MTYAERSAFFAGLLAGFILGILVTVANARNYAQNDASDPDRGFWTDSVVASCCGEGDAYFADYWESQADGSWKVWVTDERQVIGRRNDLDGRFVIVAADRIKFAPPNRTGHGIVFLSQLNPDYAYCYFPGAGG